MYSKQSYLSVLLKNRRVGSTRFVGAAACRGMPEMNTNLGAGTCCALVHKYAVLCYAAPGHV